MRGNGITDAPPLVAGCSAKGDGGGNGSSCSRRRAALAGRPARCDETDRRRPPPPPLLLLLSHGLPHMEASWLASGEDGRDGELGSEVLMLAASSSSGKMTSGSWLATKRRCCPFSSPSSVSTSFTSRFRSRRRFEFDRFPDFLCPPLFERCRLSAGGLATPMSRVAPRTLSNISRTSTPSCFFASAMRVKASSNRGKSRRRFARDMHCMKTCSASVSLK
mmetsp:Transcript_97959/g.282576  ORF Transcript_97959/g.282576 Transcript_97959/m.282576 type:complete len:220 (+) Transcript_97959:1527-2186(+)